MYPISGVFTRFIIDKIGIETFKAIYAEQNIENAFWEKGFTQADLISEFKNKTMSISTTRTNQKAEIRLYNEKCTN